MPAAWLSPMPAEKYVLPLGLSPDAQVTVQPYARLVTIHPREPKDLVLAPVAAQIDLNLQRLRALTIDEVEYELELELDSDARQEGRDGRAELVRRQATRNVDLHGWTTEITDDGCRLHLDGGSVSLDLGLSAEITAYILHGTSLDRKGDEQREHR